MRYMYISFALGLIANAKERKRQVEYRLYAPIISTNKQLVHSSSCVGFGMKFQVYQLYKVNFVLQARKQSVLYHKFCQRFHSFPFHTTEKINLLIVGKQCCHMEVTQFTFRPNCRFN